MTERWSIQDRAISSRLLRVIALALVAACGDSDDGGGRASGPEGTGIGQGGAQGLHSTLGYIPPSDRELLAISARQMA
jgi:hypothetical protein